MSFTTNSDTQNVNGSRHCQDHVSFAASHPGKKEFEEIDLMYDKSGKKTSFLLKCK